MTTRVIVTTSGYPARIISQRRNSEGEFESIPGSPLEVKADSYGEVWVPDNGQVIVHEIEQGDKEG